jgi:hypothetical protein
VQRGAYDASLDPDAAQRGLRRAKALLLRNLFLVKLQLIGVGVDVYGVKGCGAHTPSSQRSLPS